MSLPSIETLDVDGAIREADAVVAGDTRATFFRKAAVGGGAVLTSGAIMGMLPELAAARPSKRQDIAILNYAYTLELLESDFYDKAIASGALSGDTLAFAQLVAKHEAIHVKALRATIKSLGGRPVKTPKFDFMGATDEQGKFQETAFVLENTGVHAYLGQVARIKQKPVLKAAGSIITIEARHAAAIAAILNTSPFLDKNEEGGVTPDGAFDSPRGMKSIRGDAQMYIKP